MPLSVRSCRSRCVPDRSAFVKTGGSGGGTVFPARPGGPHSDLDVAGAVPGYLPHAQPLVEGLGAVVGGEHVQDEVLAVPPGLVDERADEAGADAAALMPGVDLDAGEVDLAGAVFDAEHADVCPARGDDLPVAGVEGAGVEVALDFLVPSPDRGDVADHGGFMQPEAELAVGGSGRPQRDSGHTAACPGARETGFQEEIPLWLPAVQTIVKSAVTALYRCVDG
jgi:hypothetical protein